MVFARRRDDATGEQGGLPILPRKGEVAPKATEGAVSRVDRIAPLGRYPGTFRTFGTGAVDTLCPVAA